MTEENTLSAQLFWKLSEFNENQIVSPDFKIFTLFCEIQIEEIFVSFWLAKSALRTGSSEEKLLFGVVTDIKCMCKDQKCHLMVSLQRIKKDM